MLRCCFLLLVLLALTAPAASAATIIYSPPNAAQKTAFVKLEGELKAGDAQLLEQNLRDAEKSGKQLAVVLSSSGGDIKEAMRMGRAIRKFHADTYHEYCAANCVIAFLGGERRFLMGDPSAALLVSRPDFADTFVASPTPELKKQLDALRDYALELTGDVRFYTNMMAIPFSTPHTLLPEEALATKTVTLVLH